jgi:GST-like protein
VSYRLYGAHGSGASIVESVLAELGITYDYERLDMKNHAQREAPYASVNPHMKVPTLVTPEGETITESAAIVITLAERHPDGGVLPPAKSPERARALRWLLFGAAELYPIVEIIDYPERFAPEGADPAPVKARAQSIWNERWKTVEGALGDGPYLLGETFCATDIYLAVLSRWDLPTADAPKVERLARAVGARPALTEIWARNFPQRIH